MAISVCEIRVDVLLAELHAGGFVVRVYVYDDGSGCGVRVFDLDVGEKVPFRLSDFEF